MVLLENWDSSGLAWSKYLGEVFDCNYGLGCQRVGVKEVNVRARGLNFRLILGRVARKCLCNLPIIFAL